MKKHNIVKIYGGINYRRKNGTSRVSDFCEKFKKEHPEIIEIDTDLRRDKTPYKAVYKIYTYEYMGVCSSNFKTCYKTFAEL